MAIESGTSMNRDLNKVSPVGDTVDMEFAAAQQRLRTGLLQHLGSLVDHSDHSDLEFVCSDEIRVKATKALLKGRSPVLDKMLTNGMLESSQSVIKLENISSVVLLYLLDILYAGASVYHPLVGWAMAFEAISAADFFLMPDVIKIVRKFLWTEVVQVAKDQNFAEAASMLTTAMAMECIVHDEDVIVLELIRLLNHRWTQIECALNLSEAAVDFILLKTKPALETEFSLAEYLRIREVVLWCVYQNTVDSESAIEAKRLVDCSMPLKKEDLYNVGDVVTSKTKIVWLPIRDKFDVKDGKLCQLLSTGCCKDAIARLLQSIDWLSIPAALLLQTIGPLEILSPSQLLDVLKSNVLRRHVKFRCNWIHDRSFATGKRGFVIQKTGNESRGYDKWRNNWAICQPAARRDEGMLQWRFCLDPEKLGPLFIDLGLARAPQRDLLEECTKSGADIPFEVMALRVMRREPGKVVAFLPYIRNQRYVEIPSPFTVLITFFRRGHLCTASLDGLEYSRSRHKFSFNGDWIAQRKDIFPAVYLGPSPGARVRIEFVRGFELL